MKKTTVSHTVEKMYTLLPSAVTTSATFVNGIKRTSFYLDIESWVKKKL